MKRIANSFLMLVIAIGLVQLIRGRMKFSTVHAEHRRLSDKYGSLDVLDPQQYLVRRVETGDPMHFLWMVHYPAGLRIDGRFRFGQSSNGISSTSTTFGNAGEFLERCRFEFVDDTLSMHRLIRGGGAHQRFSRKVIVSFVRDHWDELEFDELAEQGTRLVHRDELLTMLTIRIPESLHNELIEKAGAEIAKQYIDHPFFQLVCGTPNAFLEHGQPE